MTETQRRLDLAQRVRSGLFRADGAEARERSGRLAERLEELLKEVERPSREQTTPQP